MICPVELASDVSAWRAARVGDHGEHGKLLEGRDGAGDASTRSDIAGDGEEDHVVAGGGDHRDQRPADATVAGGVRRVRVPRPVRPAAGKAFAEAGAGEDVGTGVDAVSGEVFRSEPVTFSREAGE